MSGYLASPLTRRQKNPPVRHTTCKRCRRGIYGDQPATWSTDPLAPGLIHDPAANDCHPEENPRG